MRSGRYLLDTNIVIALLTGEAGLQSFLDDALEVYLPLIVIGELYFGIAKSSRPSENERRLEALLVGRRVIGVDIEVAKSYGALKLDLQRKGKPIPENDLWIAAIAQRHGLTLVSRDLHFAHLEVLPVVSWLERT